MKKTKNAIISFLGKPNVGKSTLFNAILNYKWAIISSKPQTTRKMMSVLWKNDDHQLLLVDTPGFHKKRNKLDAFLNDQINKTLYLSNIFCYIYDITRPFNIEDEIILKKINDFKDKYKILIINKAEKSTQEIIDEKISFLQQQYPFDDYLQVSALHRINIDKLLNKLFNYCHEDIDLSFYQEPDEKFIVSEIVREKCLYLLKQEIPYGIGVDIFNFKYNQETNTLLIEANIIVEKESQKPIVIGKNATMIKQIGIDARKELNEIYDCKINLKLFVKVKKDWRNNEYIINELGYKK